MERVLTARLRDAQFFYQSDRQQPLADASASGSTRCCSTRRSARICRSRSAWPKLAAQICGERVRRRRRPSRLPREAGQPVQGRSRDRHGARAHRAAGHDGRHLRARRRTARGSVEGDLLPLPAGRRRSRRRRRRKEQLGKAAITWAAVSLADKLDTVDQHVRAPASGRPARAIRTVCAAPRRASCASSSICRS